MRDGEHDSAADRPAKARKPTQPPGDEGRWRTSLAVPTLIIAMAIGLIGAIVLLARQEQDAGQVSLAGTTVEAGTLPATVPYREIAGALVVDVALGQGSRTVPMIIDTGAPTIISEDIATAFSEGSVGTVSSGSADGQVFTSDVVVLPQLAIGQATFRDVGAVVGAIEPGNPFYCASQAGFIGANLLQTGVWQIDPSARTVTMAASIDELEPLDDALRLDFARASVATPSPLIEVRAADGSLVLLIDTGWVGWLAVNPLDLEEVGLRVPDDAPAEEVLSTSTGGMTVARTAWLATELGLGDGQRRRPIAAIDSMPVGQGRAGIDFLRHFVVTLDWGADVVYLDPLDGVAAPSAPVSAGLGWVDGFVVGSVVPGLPGNDGLELAADVLALDGRDVTRAPFDEFCSRLIDTPAAAEMTIGGEAPMTVEVTLVEDFFEPLG